MNTANDYMYSDSDPTRWDRLETVAPRPRRAPKETAKAVTHDRFSAEAVLRFSRVATASIMLVFSAVGGSTWAPAEPTREVAEAEDPFDFGVAMDMAWESAMGAYRDAGEDPGLVVAEAALSLQRWGESDVPAQIVPPEADL